MNVILFENKFPLDVINLMGILGWAQSNVMGSFQMIIGYRHIGFQERRSHGDGGREWSNASTSQETRRRDKANCSLEPSERAQCFQHLDFKLPDSRVVRDDIYVVSSH